MTRCVGAVRYFPQTEGRSSRGKPPHAEEEKALSRGFPKGRRNLTVPEELKVSPLSESECARSKTLVPGLGDVAGGRLFEEFFVVGVDAEAAEGVKIKEFAFVKPKKLYQYPNRPEDQNWYRDECNISRIASVAR